MHAKGGYLLLLGASAVLLGSLFSAGRLEQTRSAPAAPQWQIDAGGSANFDIASVKQDTAAPGPQTIHSNVVVPGDTFSPTGGLFSATNYTLLTYIQFAYKLVGNGLLGGDLQKQLPGWAKTNRYDIIARAPANTTKDQFRLMMQALLADRFKFAMHTETRQEKILAMMLDKPGKLGPQLQQHTDPSDCSTTASSSIAEPTTVGGLGYPESCGIILVLKPIHSGQLRLGARNLPLSRLSNYLDSPSYIGSEMSDETGLAGQFDFVFEFTRPVPIPSNPNVEPGPDGSSLLEALKEQLGLKLVPKTGPVQVYVIDHIEEPTPN